LLWLAPIPLNPILASPETIHNYRNKCEFTFGYAAEEVTPEISPEESSEAQPSDPSTAIASAETEPSPQSQEPGTQKVATPATSPLPSLGFRVSSYKDGILVASPEGCPHIPFPMVEVVKIFKAHIRGSELKVYDQYQHNGVWRLLTVRYSERTNQMILMLCVSLKGIAEDLWSQEKQTLIEKISQAVIYPTSSVSAEAVPVVIRGFQLQASSNPPHPHPTPLLP
jgi:tRNA/tmRNA/rRNA uracil-C5-methylase (TrmA/RlmC/RlmD family)